MDATGILIFLVIFVGLPALVIAYWIGQRRRMSSAKAWPTTEATIEEGTVEVVAAVEHSKVRLPVFAFSYTVAGEFYSGRFALFPYITDPGESILERMKGRKLCVHYDPNSPARWFIPDELIEGCKIEQKLGPHLIDFSPKD